MSPKRLVVTITSNCHGFITSCIAQRIDDAVVARDPALVFLRDLAAGLEEERR